MVATAGFYDAQSNGSSSAGRLERSLEEQALCFLAGANSIFSGEKLLTRPNPDFDQDQEIDEALSIENPACFCRVPCNGRLMSLFTRSKDFSSEKRTEGLIRSLLYSKII